ncbi:MAG: type II toxin-antitoxin system HicA family toxin [Candidatus Kaiserbacteria bacterium]|nr:type II toxin-antitoxin system HicA family toxin [Candidatus Kaiserbacteria bacterium]
MDVQGSKVISKKQRFSASQNTREPFSLPKENRRESFLVVIPFHGNKTIPIGTMKSIIKQIWNFSGSMEEKRLKTELH